MQYQISHITFYEYSQPVDLEPHLIRLRPRSCTFQSLRSFQLEVTPTPTGISNITDLAGNDIIKIWFSEQVEKLTVQVVSHVETHCTNPFEYLLEPWALELPITDYPAPTFAHLQPYLQLIIDPVAMELAQDVWYRVGGQTVLFLSELNQQIYQTCGYTIRETGSPLPPRLTWKQQLGSCRDVAVLFMDACRAMGLAARFVSGYQEADPEQPEQHLHAWVEVYLPGAGWRGYDPTQGLVVSDRHIALVSSAIPVHAAPVSGRFRGMGVESKISYQLGIDKI